jgi:hypothetical protein
MYFYTICISILGAESADKFVPEIQRRLCPKPEIKRFAGLWIQVAGSGAFTISHTVTLRLSPST